MSTPAQAPTEKPVNACACRLANIYLAPQTLFSTETINPKNPDHFIGQLRQAVEDMTHRGLTVRKASPQLFSEQWFWLHVAVGSYASFGHDEGMVTEHNDLHTLFGAYGIGDATLVVADKAPAELLEKRHQEQACRYRQSMADKAGLSVLKEKLPLILEALRNHIIEHADALTRADAQARLDVLAQAEPQAITLLQLVTICELLEVDVVELLVEALP